MFNKDFFLYLTIYTVKMINLRYSLSLYIIWSIFFAQNDSRQIKHYMYTHYGHFLLWDKKKKVLQHRYLVSSFY